MADKNNKLSKKKILCLYIAHFHVVQDLVEAVKRREILARQPSYCKILNDLKARDSCSELYYMVISKVVLSLYFGNSDILGQHLGYHWWHELCSVER